MKAGLANVTEPPLWVAWRQALASIRVRFARHALTAAGIALGTAFFASMLALRAIEAHAGSADAAAASRMAWLSYVSLLMCLLGVTNSMLMSVTERYREIGTIKCLGATNGFIIRVFLLEAGILGSVASLSGALVGSALMSVALAIAGYEIPVGAVVRSAPVAAGAGLLLTLFSAIVPAIAAARMPAVAALRVEV